MKAYFGNIGRSSINLITKKELPAIGRQRLQTTFSQISAKLPKSIHAVTTWGFELKIALFIIAFACNCL